MRMSGGVRRVRYIAHVLLLIGLLWLIIGAGATSTAAADTQIAIQGFAFSPATLSVPVGTTVTWTNKDSAGHDVTSTNGAFASKTLATGQSFSFTFNQAGTFSYGCTIHPRMVASITVTGSAAAVLPKTGEVQNQRNWGMIAALVAAAAVIGGGTILRSRACRIEERGRR